MATASRTLDAQVRAHYMELISSFLTSSGEEVLQAGSNELALPCVDSEGNDKFIVLTFKVPTGSRDGDAYDGYAMAEAFKMKEAEKAEKAKVAAAKKAAKVERDKKAREAKKAE